MKKQVLIVMNHLHCGGAEKSLVSLLHGFDYERYEVDLLLFKREGLFLGQVPEQVNLLDPPPNYHFFDMPIVDSIRECWSRGLYRIAVARIGAGILFKTDSATARREQRLWPYFRTALPPLSKSYDAAIGFLEKTPVYYCIDQVKADRKLGFIHNDYIELGMDPSLDRKRFEGLQHLVTVSEGCGDVLKEVFPRHADKVKVIQNVVSPSLIQRLSGSPVPSFRRNANAALIVTVGRLHRQKGLDMAIDACKELRDRGIAVEWHVLGEGEERGALEKRIARHGLQDVFFLDGVRDNPYPYMRQADVYVQPSRYEGKSIAIDEAKILALPIVTTRYSTAGDQIAHMENGMIVDMEVSALREGVERLLLDRKLAAAFSEKLAGEWFGTEGEAQKLYELIG